MNTKPLSDKVYTGVCLFSLAFGLFFLFWRAPYGFFFNDEPFCITIAQRLFFGDRLLSDEWNACQNVGILILPFYRLFHLFSDSNEGILLFCRYCYCVLWFGTCAFAFFSLNKKYGASVVVFLYLILFAPLDYMTLSYTSMSLMACIAICTLLYLNIVHTRMPVLLFSVLFSFFSCIFVLCYPYLAVLYLLAFVFLIVLYFAVRDKTDPQLLAYWKKIFLSCTLLISAAAILYLYFFALKDVPLSSIADSLPYIFSSPEHQGITSFGTVVKGFLRVLGYSRGYTLLLVISSLFYLCSQKFPALKPYRYPVFVLVALYFVRCQIIVCTQFDKIEYNTLNQQILGIVYLGILAYLFLEERPKTLFLCYVPLSVCYAVLASISSNTGMLVIAMALSVAGIPSIIFIALLCREFYGSYSHSSVKASVCVFLVALMAFQVSSELYVRLTRFYWDAPMSEITLPFTAGAGAGVVTSEEYYEEYSSDYEALSSLLKMCDDESLNDAHFLSLKSSPVLYLDADLPYGIYSSWSFRMTPEWLMEYYRLHPERVANLIFTDEENDSAFSSYFDIQDYNVLEYRQYKMYVRKHTS